MALVKDGEHATDIFACLNDEDTLPNDSQAIIVSLDRWLADRDILVKRSAPMGVILNPDQSPDTISEDLQYLSTIVVKFPVFSDGRGFSHARRLRETYGFDGEIRASGHLIRDQYLFLHRCGVNAIEVKDQASAEQWKIAMDEFSLFYQNTIDSRNPLMRLRQQSGTQT